MTAVVCLLACATGCSDGPAAPPASVPSTGPSSSTPPAVVPELQPGAPGEDTTTRNPADTAEEPDATHDDVAFVQMMVLHHRQALDLAGLVSTPRTDNRELALAA